MGVIELFTQAREEDWGGGGGDLGPGVVTMPVVKEGTEEGQKTMSHFSNELNIPSECLLVSQM